MRKYEFYDVAKNVHRDRYRLEEDMICLLRKHNASLTSTIEQFRADKDTGNMHRTMYKTYELPPSGVVMTGYSSTDEINRELYPFHEDFTQYEINGKPRETLDRESFRALIRCLGFDWESEKFKNLERDLEKLRERYSPDEK